jgi:hypothetical protein
MPLGRLAVFRLPHRALLCESSANKESQLIHPTQLLLRSALRFDPLGPTIARTTDGDASDVINSLKRQANSKSLAPDPAAGEKIIFCCNLEGSSREFNAQDSKNFSSLLNANLGLTANSQFLRPLVLTANQSYGIIITNLGYSSLQKTYFVFKLKNHGM